MSTSTSQEVISLSSKEAMLEENSGGKGASLAQMISIKSGTVYILGQQALSPCCLLCNLVQTDLWAIWADQHAIHFAHNS